MVLRSVIRIGVKIGSVMKKYTSLQPWICNIGIVLFIVELIKWTHLAQCQISICRIFAEFHWRVLKYKMVLFSAFC